MKVAYEHVRPGETASFYSGRFEGASFPHSYHMHEEIELVYIVKGRGRLVTGDYSGRFEKGELFLFGENLPHAFFCDTAPDGAAGQVRSLYVQFKRDCFGELFFNLPEMNHAGKLLDRSGRGARFIGIDRDETEALLDSLFTADSMLKMARFLELMDMVSGLQKIQLLATEQYIRTEVHRESERLSRAIDYLHRNYAEQMTLDDVATAAHLSPAAFSRFFKKHMGQSYIDYLIELRLSEASRLLLETDAAITEIAFSVGFRNLSHFNRQFLKRKNMSPREFRIVK